MQELLEGEYLPETRVCCAITHRKFTVASIAGITVPSPPDSDDEDAADEDAAADEEEVEDEEKAARKRAKKTKRQKFEAHRREIQEPADRPGEFVVHPPWGVVICSAGAELLRANDVVGLYAVKVEGV